MSGIQLKINRQEKVTDSDETYLQWKLECVKLKKRKRHKILDGINRLDVEEKMINGLKGIAIKTTQN